jgi:hypothetical protein
MSWRVRNVENPYQGALKSTQIAAQRSCHRLRQSGRFHDLRSSVGSKGVENAKL